MRLVLACLSLAAFTGLSTIAPLRAADSPSEGGASFPGEDKDQDGLTNDEEAEYHSSSETSQTDSDSLPDGQDAVPNDPDFAFSRVPVTQYALVDLGEGSGRKINNRLQVVMEQWSGDQWGGFALWSEGEKTTLILPQKLSDFNPAENFVLLGESIMDSPFFEDTPVTAHPDYTSVIGLGDQGQVFIVIDGIPLLPGPNSISAGLMWTKNSGYRIVPTTGWLDEPLRHLEEAFEGTFATVHKPSGSGYVQVNYNCMDQNGKVYGSAYAGGFLFFINENESLWAQYVYAYGGSTDLSYLSSFSWTSNSAPVAESLTLDDAEYGLDSSHTGPTPLEAEILDWQPNSFKPVVVVSPDGNWKITSEEGLYKINAQALTGGTPKCVNNWQTPIIGGNDNTPYSWKTQIWLKANNQWKTKPLYAVHNPDATTPIYGSVGKINDRGQMLVGGASLWQNGKTYSISSLTPATQGADAKWGPLAVTDLNDKGLMVGTSTQIKNANGTNIPAADQKPHAVILLPVQMKLLWETENKANQIYNPTKKDDPWYYEGFGSTGGSNNGASRNRLFLVPDPEDNKYKATLEVEMPEEFRTKFLAAAYVVDTKVANSDKAFDAEGKCELEFEHLGTSEDIQDFAIRIGYDANNSGTLDPEEITKLAVKNFGEPLIRGTKTSKYNTAKDKIDNIVDGDWTTPGWATDLVLPHAKQFLRIFRQGDTAGVPSNKLPTSSSTVSFDAFNGYFSEWLTHNSGAPFNDEGVASITDYTWNFTTDTADMVATSQQIQGAVHDFYYSSVTSQAAAYLASQPVGTVAYFPSSTGFYDVPHTHESPGWVPTTTVTFHNLPAVPPLPSLDDVNGTIGRGRLLSHKVRYKVEKREITEWVQDGYVTYTANIPTEIISQGVAIDLYDFNHMVGGAAQDAAILQIGFGKGAYGAARDRGKIYRNRIEFEKTYTSLP